MTKLTGHADWEWFGYAEHLIVAPDCRFHLTTLVGNFWISTVGAYYPPSQKHEYMEPVGSHGALFETLVFKQGEIDPVEMLRCHAAEDARTGHYKMCWKYHKESTL